MKFSEIPIKSYVNGQRSISFIIKKTPDEDLKKIANSLEKYITKFNSENKDFEILTLFQFSDMLDQRIETLSDNLILGLILVLIVLGFFLSFRLSAGCLWNSIFFYWYDIYWYSLWNDNKYDLLIWNDISCWNFSR